MNEKCKCCGREDWISVKDRLPNRNERVGYTFDAKKGIRNDVYFPGYNGSWESENALDFSIDEFNILYWMKFPERPVP